MLWDPRHDHKTEADVFSLAGLIEWLEKQNPHRGYQYNNCHGGCLIGRYATAMSADFYDLHTYFFNRRELFIASNEPHTFGAALDRAREYARAQS